MTEPIETGIRALLHQFCEFLVALRGPNTAIRA
jgi:hypothetical protein